MQPETRQSKTNEDSLISKLIDKTEPSVSRRGLLAGLAELTGLVMGVSFMASSVVGAGLDRTEPSEPEPGSKAGFGPGGCTLNDSCDADGKWCGMTGYKCTHFTGTNCYVPPNGCPAGTTTGGNWFACCVCSNDSTKRIKVYYHDCCGTVDTTKCSGSLPGSFECDSMSKRCNASANWCGGAGNYLCTWADKQGPCAAGESYGSGG